MCGIFAYLNHLKPRERRFILETLITGLKRLEYRGYDSAGIAVDSGNESDEWTLGAGDTDVAGNPLENLEATSEGDAITLNTNNKNVSAQNSPSANRRGICIMKEKGKVAKLEELVEANIELDQTIKINTHVGIAHTRWATHGVPSPVNSHPQRSSDDNEFVVVHNGIITNYRQLKTFLIQQDYHFESETDTEVIAKLMKYLYDHRGNDILSFGDLVERAIGQLEGAFACVFKSIHFPGEIVATRRGSPLLVGIKSDTKLSTDHIPILFSAGDHIPKSQANDQSGLSYLEGIRRRCSSGTAAGLGFSRKESTTDFFGTTDENPSVEYFFASDASAIIEHTNKVLYLEDDDVAAVVNGQLSIHRMKRDQNNKGERAIQELEIQLETIMKGKYEF